jgi:uncharacterized protein YbjT (DUF2867 family)
MPDPDVILVTGATGNTSSPLVSMLEARGVSIRAMIRRAGDDRRLDVKSASPVVADFDDPASLESALDGVTRAYLVTPSSAAAEEQQVRFAELAARAGVLQIVLLSQYASAEDSPVRFLRYHAAVERRIRELGVGYTFLRPNLFMQGLLGFASTIASDGAFFAPIGVTRVSMVDVRDIADVAAAALTEPGHLGQTYDITGPEAVTHGDVAAALSRALGRSVIFSDVPPEAFGEVMSNLGMPSWQVDGLLEDYEHYRRGEAAAVSPAVREVTGHAPRDINAFARDYARPLVAHPAS